MKKFKIIDIRISIIIIGIAVCCIPIDGTLAFCIGYFGTGGWQIISMLVHFCNGWFCFKSSRRSRYHWHVSMIILGVVVSLISPVSLIAALGIMLIVSPVMAIFYITLCYEEVYVKMRRPLADLK